MAVNPIGPWPRGVNLLNPVGSLEPSELSRCENFRLDVNGRPLKRPGHSVYGNGTAFEALVPGSSGQFLFRFYKADNTKKLVGISNGELHQGNDVTGEWTAISGGGSFSSTGLAQGAVYKDRLYIVDGTYAGRWAGGSAPLVGVGGVGYLGTAPTATSSATAGSLVPAEVYKYGYTTVHGTMGESGLSLTSTVTILGGHSSVAISNGALAANTEGSAIRYYRTKKNGNVFYFLREEAYGAFTGNDGVLDSALGAEYIPAHSPPTEARFVLIGPDDRAYWFGRTGVNASIVEVSEVGWPDRILDGDFFTINNNDGDTITAGCKVPGGILFFKRNSTWLIRQYGSAPINISYHYGCAAPFSIQITPDGCIFLSQQGKICVYNGSVTEIARSVRPELQKIPEASLARIVSAYHNDLYMIAYDYRGTAGFNNRILEFDMIDHKWMGPHKNSGYYTPGYFCVLDSVKDQGELYWISGRSGTGFGSFVYKQDENVSKDNDKGFVSVLQTGQNALPSLETKEVIRSMVRGQFSSDVTLDVNIITEDNVKTTSHPLNGLGGEGSLYGTAIYGASLYGGIFSTFAEDSFDTPAKGHAPMVEVTDGGRGTFLKLDTVELITKSLSLE